MRKAIVLLALLAVGCAPVLDELGREFEEAAQQQRLTAQLKQRQERLQANPPIPRARCFARDGIERTNRLQQGPNLCIVSGLAPAGMGTLQRLRVRVEYRYPEKQPFVWIDDFVAADRVFNEERVAFPENLLMPDSLTGALMAAGIGKMAMRSAFVLLLGELGLPPSLVMSQFPALDRMLDSQGNFKDASNRFSNLGERPYTAFLQFQICSDVCVVSRVLQLETK